MCLAGVAAFATGFTAADGGAGVVPTGTLAGAVLASRDFFRNGLVCLATLSHSVCSSSLSTRLRRGGGSDRSGIDDGTRRFIGGDNDA